MCARDLLLINTLQGYNILWMLHTCLLLHICMHAHRVFLVCAMNASLVRSKRLQPQGHLWSRSAVFEVPGRNKEQGNAVFSQIRQFCCVSWLVDMTVNDAQNRRRRSKQSVCLCVFVNLAFDPWSSTVSISSLHKRKIESETATPQTQECGLYIGRFIRHEEKRLPIEFRKPHPTLTHRHTPT